MNDLTLTADGPRSWLAPTLTGAATTLVATAIVAFPTFGRTAPVPATPSGTPMSYVVPDDSPATPATDGDGNCFIYRARWNVALDGARPVCNWGGHRGTH